MPKIGAIALDIRVHRGASGPARAHLRADAGGQVRKQMSRKGKPEKRVNTGLKDVCWRVTLPSSEPPSQVSVTTTTTWPQEPPQLHAPCHHSQQSGMVCIISLQRHVEACPDPLWNDDIDSNINSDNFFMIDVKMQIENDGFRASDDLLSAQ